MLLQEKIDRIAVSPRLSRPELLHDAILVAAQLRGVLTMRGDFLGKLPCSLADVRSPEKAAAALHEYGGLLAAGVRPHRVAATFLHPGTTLRAEIETLALHGRVSPSLDMALRPLEWANLSEERVEGEHRDLRVERIAPTASRTAMGSPPRAGSRTRPCWPRSAVMCSRRCSSQSVGIVGRCCAFRLWWRRCTGAACGGSPARCSVCLSCRRGATSTGWGANSLQDWAGLARYFSTAAGPVVQSSAMERLPGDYILKYCA